MLWSAEEMLDGQNQRVDIPANARTFNKDLLQERLEKDLCWIVSRVPLMMQSVKGPNWRVFFSGKKCFTDSVCFSNRMFVSLTVFQWQFSYSGDVSVTTCLYQWESDCIHDRMFYWLFVSVTEHLFQWRYVSMTECLFHWQDVWFSDRICLFQWQRFQLKLHLRCVPRAGHCYINCGRRGYCCDERGCSHDQPTGCLHCGCRSVSFSTLHLYFQSWTVKLHGFSWSIACHHAFVSLQSKHAP